MSLRLALVGLILCSQYALRAGDEPPRWLAAANQQQSDAGVTDAPALALWHEAEVTIDESGKITTAERYAVRILKREGRKEAVAAKFYEPDTDKVRELRGWIISPSGQVRGLRKDQVADLEVGDSLYEQTRARSLMAPSECAEGWVFAYESLVEERSIFTQLEWHFQGRLPVLLSRYTLHVPRGWEVKTLLLNHATVRPIVAGDSFSWELRDLPYLEAAPGSPPVSSLAPRLAISLFPVGKTTLGESFANWQDVSRYTSVLHDPQSLADAAITTRAQLLTSGATSEIDKIRAIARFVQNMRYVSIQTEIGRGGGYRPHAAASVLARGYGDCKDKANLMRAMLRAVGIVSFPVLIYSGDARYVRAEWPSPRQFNHCIIAIVVSDAVTGYPIIRVPSVGRLLIFDSTDPDIPIGEIPDDEQNSLALIAAGGKGALIRVPERPAEKNKLERTTELTLSSDGSLRGSFEERFSGRMAIHARIEYRQNANIGTAMERLMGEQVPGVSISAVQPTDGFLGNTFELRAQLAAAHYAQIMQDRLFVFRPDAIPRPAMLRLIGKHRRYPIVLRSESFLETVTAKLPASFVVDEIPAGKRVEGDPGVFVTTCVERDREVIWVRSLTIKPQIIPANRYAEVESFFQQVAAEEAEPIVLVKTISFERNP